ncbi:cyanophycinase [Rhodovibrio salinarum]|uniref:Cyanophycinase n=1 Tax=Rhodovibrio salinarum TaxID=1087 RepID=A0A934QGY3_9PROT|nr:cyanophycinase [Rhodovibrio salinarum]MBK1696365.1 cyanophycinase [Rhodovibrio salinarum]
MSAHLAQAPGCLVAIGGAEDKTSARAVLRHVLKLTGVLDPTVAVLATASQIPELVLPMYHEAFRGLGVQRVHTLDVRTRHAANAPAAVAQVEAADVIFMTGGDQLRLTYVLGGTTLLDAIRRRHAAGAVIAGTSAGAAAMSRTMIYDGDAAASMHKGNVKMTSGLGFVRGVVIDSHFVQCGRFTRLMEVGAANPERLGLGLGEDTAVVVHPDRVLEAVGTGHVIVVDSWSIDHSNVAEIAQGDAITVSNVTVHALTAGLGFDMETRRVLPPDMLLARTAPLFALPEPAVLEAGAWRM